MLVKKQLKEERRQRKPSPDRSLDAVSAEAEHVDGGAPLSAAQQDSPTGDLGAAQFKARNALIDAWTCLDSRSRHLDFLERIDTPSPWAKEEAEPSTSAGDA